jgi:hypothetical protein
VEFPECDNVRLISNVVGDPLQVGIGSMVELIWGEVDGQALPRFRLVAPSEETRGE